MQHFESAAVGLNLKDGAAVASAAGTGRSVERRSIEQQAAFGANTLAPVAIEVVQIRIAAAIGIDFEQRAEAIVAAGTCRAVERVAEEGQLAQRQSAVAAGAGEGMHDRVAGSIRIDLENRTVVVRSSIPSRAIERRADERHTGPRRYSFGVRVERMQEAVISAVCIDLENRSAVGTAAVEGRAIECRAAEREAAHGIAAIVRAAGERVNDREAAAVGIDLEHRAVALGAIVGIFAGSVKRGPDERQTATRILAAGANAGFEGVQNAKLRPVGVHFENRTSSCRAPAVVSRAV